MSIFTGQRHNRPEPDRLQSALVTGMNSGMKFDDTAVIRFQKILSGELSINDARTTALKERNALVKKTSPENEPTRKLPKSNDKNNDQGMKH
jgi:hypothetical protein